MATNFPTSVDALTNPVSNDSLNSPSHSAQHTNANDAIEAIETYLLGDGASGLVLITSTNFSAASSVSVDNAFSATYENYKVLIYADFSANVFCDFRFRASSADNTTSNYRNYLPNNAYDGTGISGFSGQDISFVRIMGSSTGTKPSSMSMDVFSPQAAANTNFLYSTAGETRTGAGGGTFNSTTQFDGFSFFPQSGTITGTVKIYGYRN